MSNPANIADVAALWRPLSTQEQVTGTALLDMAWAMMQTQVPETLAIVDGSVPQTNARYVLASAVLRVLKNPDNAKSESIDDYSFTRDDSAAPGSLMFTEDEIALLRGVVSVRVASVSMDPGCL
jgi:hypothetical protein